MLKNVYFRCKYYLNSYVTIGTIISLLLFLLLPAFTYKKSYNFFFIIINAYQHPLVITLTLMTYIYNTWNYLNKNINIIYQLHRYKYVNEIIKNNIFDSVFIGIILELVFLILNISIAIIYNDGYYLSQYKFYNITNLSYSLYIFVVKLVFISILSIFVYFIYYSNSKLLKFFLAFVIFFNLINFDNLLPISMNTILSGYKFDSFCSELLLTLLIITIYIFVIIVIKRKFINMKRDIL